MKNTNTTGPKPEQAYSQWWRELDAQTRRGFEQQFLRPTLRATVRGLDGATLDDLAQRTHLKILTTSSRHREGDFRGWLRQVARSVALDWLRHTARQPRTQEIDGDVPHRAALSPEAQCHHRRLLREALAELTWEEAACLHLHVARGLTFRQTGELLGISHTRVWRNICRARRRLQDLDAQT